MPRGADKGEYRLTVRNGSTVTRERADLDRGLELLRERVGEIRSQGNLPEAKMLRRYEPAQQVAGRVELSNGGLLRGGKSAGIDVMGDGTLIPFTGGSKRRELNGEDSESPFELVERELRGI
ncbi:hypothetical protein HJD18_14505 [Thermoleophilia bacterium SCSIO 60948]|nr:hypothetical protein HJD18_14505 [Thermoleophilia bacterium SCSIO 60948]